MTRPYACVRDGTVIAHGTWCPTCHDDTLVVAPPAATPQQLQAIWRYFTHRGEVNRNRRLQHLTNITGRVIDAYTDLTQAEAAHCAAELRKWAHGK